MLPNSRCVRSALALFFFTFASLITCISAGAQATGSLTPGISVSPTNVYLGKNESQAILVNVTGGGAVPTGNVILLQGTTPLQEGPLNLSGIGVFVVENLPVGVCNCTAAYLGDSNYKPVSTPVTISTVAGTVPTATNLLAIPTNLPPNGATQLQAQVLGFPDTPTPTGTVFFTDGATMLGSAPLDSSAQGNFFVTGLAPGKHALIANYSGDANYQPSAGGPVNVTVATPNTPAISLTGTLSSSGSGLPVTFTTTVTPQGGQTATPTGSVTYDYGETQLGVSNLNSQGVSTLVVPSLPGGTDTVLATYTGDLNYNIAFTTTTVKVPEPAAPPPADFSMSVSPTVVTAPGSGTSTTQVAITPENGFSSQITFACSGLPAMSTCSFSPGSFSGTQNASVTMTISTGNAPMALLKDDGNGPAKIAFAFAGLLGVFALRRRRRGWPLVAVLILLGATGVVSLSGCGSSSPTTPAGVYEATVTATSGTLSHTASFALQVK
jgi:hypothetical protein